MYLVGEDHALAMFVLCLCRLRLRRYFATIFGGLLLFLILPYPILSYTTTTTATYLIFQTSFHLTDRSFISIFCCGYILS